MANTNSRFRSSFTDREGLTNAKIVQCRVVNIHLNNWTVDVVSQFDRHRYFDIQVGAPYLHYSAGEGIYVVPEVGAMCMVCIPSDSTAPFVQTFLMPHEFVDTGTPDAPGGTRSHGSAAQNATDASFAGGRGRPKPGDIVLRGRDGNFMILHRGGVLQIGANELAQRLFIPLNNLVTDIAENYAMHTAGGSIIWGLQDGPSLSKYPTQHMQTFRIFANDKFADMRVCIGKVYAPVPEPDNGVAMAGGGVGVGEDNPIICELTVAPDGFDSESGDAADAGTGKRSVLKFVFDRTGNTLLRTEGNLSTFVKKKLTMKVTDAIEISGDAHIGVTAKDGMDLDGGAYAHVKGGIVRLGAGVQPVARVGDLVTTPIAIPTPITMPGVLITFPVPGAAIAPGTPVPATIQGTIMLGLPGAPIMLTGTITTGNNKVLA
jgi:hypothetical protein